jgi:hypothetical protein
MEQEGAAPEEGEAPLSHVPPPPREVEYVRVQRGPATRWVDLKGGAAGGGMAKYVAWSRRRCDCDCGDSHMVQPARR